MEEDKEVTPASKVKGEWLEARDEESCEDGMEKEEEKDKGI